MIIEPYTWHASRISEIIPVAKDTIAIRLVRPENYVFRAGQYAITRTHVSEQKSLIRQYSFSSSPDDPWLELTIQKEPGGEVTTWLHEQARVGDTIDVSQSFGQFTFDSVARPLLFIAGRVGIAPFMSHLRHVRSGEISVLYSVKDESQLCYWDDLKDITTAVITARQPRIDQGLLAKHIVNRPLIYICGSRQFAESIQSHLHDLGIPATDIRRELFTL